MPRNNSKGRKSERKFKAEQRREGGKLLTDIFADPGSESDDSADQTSAQIKNVGGVVTGSVKTVL